MRVAAINIAPGRKAPMQAVDEVRAEKGKGLVGDRYHGARNRQVTVQSTAGLDAAAAELGYGFAPSATRRNITVEGGPIPTGPGTRVRIGEVELELAREATPCRVMESSVGPGAEAALRGRAGSAFRVLTSGTIRVGDPVTCLD